ncbi:MAG TPA: PhnA domain-containing protein [Bacteroidia bacterium]|nr:PhnA domain-containing protein [Bacteroidia bacterium]
MTLEEQLIVRSGGSCELCKSKNALSVYSLPPERKQQVECCIHICEKCQQQIEKREELAPGHWTCLRETMWSDVPPVQIQSWRLLNRLKNESWASEALEIYYLDDELLETAKASGDHLETSTDTFHRDCNGVILQAGDSVTLIKSLDVKGSQINAKIGTVVKNIRLVSDNNEQIEGKIEGQQIVILTKFVRKAG